MEITISQLEKLSYETNKKLINTLLKLHKKGELSAKTCADTIFRIIKNQ